MKNIILILFFTFNLIKAEGIQSDVEEILLSEFPSHSAMTMQKFDLPSDLKTQTEKQVRQKFFKDYVYLWKICQGDSIVGYAILDNTYGKSLPITFLVIFLPTGEIRRIDIIRYREPYGGAIVSRRWLDQFTGKSINDEFKVDKDPGMIPYVLSQILDTCINGITLSDPDQPDNPIVYANEAFELITGYDQEEIVGRNCRFLQGDDRDQPEIEQIGKALRERKPVTVTLRNYRKDGELFYNQFSIRPLFDPQGRLIYYLGTQYDVTEKIRAEEELRRLNALLAKVDG